MSNAEDVQSSVKQLWDSARKKAWDLYELMARHVKKSSDDRTEQIKRKLSHLGLIVSETNEKCGQWHLSTCFVKTTLFLGERKHSEIQETTVIMTATRMAGSMKEVTVYVNDMDPFVPMTLVEDSRRNGLLS